MVIKIFLRSVYYNNIVQFLSAWLFVEWLERIRCPIACLLHEVLDSDVLVHLILWVIVSSVLISQMGVLALALLPELPSPLLEHFRQLRLIPQVLADRQIIVPREDFVIRVLEIGPFVVVLLHEHVFGLLLHLCFLRTQTEVLLDPFSVRHLPSSIYFSLISLIFSSFIIIPFQTFQFPDLPQCIFFFVLIIVFVVRQGFFTIALFIFFYVILRLDRLQ
jgi:hypothetical protein